MRKKLLFLASVSLILASWVLSNPKQVWAREYCDGLKIDGKSCCRNNSDCGSKMTCVLYPNPTCAVYVSGWCECWAGWGCEDDECVSHTECQNYSCTRVLSSGTDECYSHCGCKCCDTDGGENVWVKGTVTLPGKTPFTDYCSDPYCGPCSDCTECVAEGSCSGEEVVVSFISCAKLGATCQNGRCVMIVSEPENQTVTVTGTTAWPEKKLRLYSINLEQPFGEPFLPGTDGNWALHHARMDDIGFRVCTADCTTCSEPVTPARKFWWGVHLR